MLFGHFFKGYAFTLGYSVDALFTMQNGKKTFC